MSDTPLVDFARKIRVAAAFNAPLKIPRDLASGLARALCDLDEAREKIIAIKTENTSLRNENAELHDHIRWLKRERLAVLAVAVIIAALFLNGGGK